MIPRRAACAALSAAVWATAACAGSDERLAQSPLAPFERLIGGQWHYESGYQEFSWGAGKASVRSRNYFNIDGEFVLVAEGMWFWHPGEQAIKGTFTAVDMPVVLFDYTTRFDGATMKNTLVSYSASGEATTNEETWEFTDADTYVWTLFRRTDSGLEKQMGGTFRRKR